MITSSTTPVEEVILNWTDLTGKKTGATGQACFELGDAKCTYGTGAFALVNVGSEPVMSKNGLVTTVGFRIGNETTYALEGSSFIAGAAVQWLRDGLGLVAPAKDIEPLAAQVDGTGGVYFVPALAGLGAPHWDQGARGTISGITRGTTKAHLARATLEGIAFSVADLNVACICYNAWFNKADFGRWPALKAWLDRCLTRPAYAKIRKLREG